MHRNIGSIFYVQCVLGCMVLVYFVSVYLYIISDDSKARMPLYYPSTTSFQAENTMTYIPEFRIVPHIGVYQRLFRLNTDAMVTRLLQELLLEPHSIYMKYLIPSSIGNHSIMVGSRNENNQYMVFVQLYGDEIRLSRTMLTTIEQWLQYNVNRYFPVYDVHVTQI